MRNSQDQLITNKGRLNGKVAVVTGAAGSLGSAIVDQYLSEGCLGVVMVDLAESRLGPIAASSQDRCLVLIGDVCDEEFMNSVVDAAVSTFGRLDVMVNNAGVLAPNARIHNVESSDWRRVLEINVMGVVNGATAALRVMRPARSGTIINTASVSAMTAWSHAAPYGASKAAVVSITKSIAIEYAKEGIRANCVCPGSFESKMFSGVPEVAIEAIADRHPLGLGDPAKLVGTFVFLASDESEWMTGAAVVIDGGYSIP
jgi:NAD(P)-dependent dehydrogenase (short-subunit alcohol dehydrogenase family)